MITNFENKKLIEYLKPEQKVLIRFGHGWGDTLMFMPVFYWLQKQYPETQVDIYLEAGQEKIFESAKDKEGKGYDLVFSLDFPMSEGSSLTKQHKCMIEEIGIDPELHEIGELANLRRYGFSPFVAVHFQGTALPGSVNCPEGIAKRVWQEIKDEGYIPIECHFEHLFHNPTNKKYDFVNRHTRDIKPDLNSLIGLIRHSFAFVGVASGPLVTALSIMPDGTFFLENKHKINSYTSYKIAKANINNYRKGAVKKWLKEIRA